MRVLHQVLSTKPPLHDLDGSPPPGQDSPGCAPRHYIGTCHCGHTAGSLHGYPSGPQHFELYVDALHRQVVMRPQWQRPQPTCTPVAIIWPA